MSSEVTSAVSAVCTNSHDILSLVSSAMAAPVNSSDAAIASDLSKGFILFLLGFLRLFQKTLLCLGSRDQQALSKATIGTTKALSCHGWLVRRSFRQERSRL